MLKRTTVLLLAQLMVFACSSKSDKNAGGDQAQVNEYPNLTLSLETGGTIATRDLEGNNIFVFFQPDCRHCQLEAIDIEQRLDAFKGYTLYFISSAPMEAITAFAESLDLDGRKNVSFARAPTEAVLEHYGPIQTPSVYIYADGKLKESFNGQTEIENILEAL